MSGGLPEPAGSGRFALSFDARGHVTKRGAPQPLRREALALRAIAGRGLGPDLIEAADGLIVTTLLPGASRPIAGLEPRAARALGRALRRLHDVRHAGSASLPGWTARAYSVARYRDRRAADVLAAVGRHRARVRRLLDGLPPLPPAAAMARPPFRFLHGDLVAANILWSPEPRFVDFEFWRLGDPAEDLAYLAELNHVPGVVWRPLIAGYGDPAVAARVDAWRAVCALDGAVWYAGTGRDDLAEPLFDRAAALRDGEPVSRA